MTAFRICRLRAFCGTTATDATYIATFFAAAGA
jgi:hypothetical protein